MKPPLYKLNEHLNMKAAQQASFDCAMFGDGYSIHLERKWWNPMRYILGKNKIKALDSTKVMMMKFSQGIKQNKINKRRST